MNIIEQVKAIITACPLMTDFTNGVEVDYTENTVGTFGMYSTGDSLISTDILGGENRRHNFVLYATNQPITNYERLENTGFLLNLGYYLDKIKDVELTDNNTIIGHIKKLTASNAMLFDVPTGDIKDGVRYQLQLQAEYYLNP